MPDLLLNTWPAVTPNEPNPTAMHLSRYSAKMKLPTILIPRSDRDHLQELQLGPAPVLSGPKSTRSYSTGDLGRGRRRAWGRGCEAPEVQLEISQSTSKYPGPTFPSPLPPRALMPDRFRSTPSLSGICLPSLAGGNIRLPFNELKRYGEHLPNSAVPISGCCGFESCSGVPSIA
jgi:hypothetical protein